MYAWIYSFLRGDSPTQFNIAIKSPPSAFKSQCHPNEATVSEEINGYYLKHWNFPDEKARTKFVAAGFSRVTCLYFPKALDSRIRYACSLLTILFLIDDQLEYMSLEDGKSYNEYLMPYCKGETAPDRSSPVERIMYDLWEDMRSCDKQLADELIEPVFEFMRAQTSKERLQVQGLGPYLAYRQGDVGQALLATLMRFSMSLHLSPEEHDSVTEIERNCGRHISIVNDIYSFEKELLASQTAHKEGGYLCNSVQILASEASLSIPVSKKVLWVMCREWELVHNELATKRFAALEGCSEGVKAYVKGLEYHMSGNELWSKTTQRYKNAKA